MNFVNSTYSARVSTLQTVNRQYSWVEIGGIVDCNCADWIRALLKMEIDSSSDSYTLSPTDRIIQVIVFPH